MSDLSSRLAPIDGFRLAAIRHAGAAARAPPQTISTSPRRPGVAPPCAEGRSGVQSNVATTTTPKRDRSRRRAAHEIVGAPGFDRIWRLNWEDDGGADGIEPLTTGV
jgi:hypothetical protein